MNILVEHSDGSIDQGTLIRVYNYYQKFPKVVEFLNQLADLSKKKSWTLKRDNGSHRAGFEVNKLGETRNIAAYFNPNRAAVLLPRRIVEGKRGFIIACAADILLHELIHVQHALENSYSWGNEERRTIEKERILFKHMTEIDGHPRPQRILHDGGRAVISKGPFHLGGDDNFDISQPLKNALPPL